MYFSRGFPVVYYGDEQGFTGDGGDKDAREDMMPSQVAVLQRQQPDRHRRYHSRQQFRRDTSAVPNTAEILPGLRTAHPALRQGAQIHRYSQGSAAFTPFPALIEPNRLNIWWC